eukprot:c17152_g2_i2.p1 GENE.c17152_g2_i2~~c17152_g2_i2.p1  ORF type:complete len:338 (+),score=55.90 c17152_g2_i2:40-1053(+)
MGLFSCFRRSSESPRRLSITNQPPPVSSSAPIAGVEGRVECDTLIVEYASVSLAGTYFQPSINPFKQAVKYKTNQDMYFVTEQVGGQQGAHLFGVLDGHGQTGHFCSQFIAENIPKILGSRSAELFSSPAQALTHSFLEVDKQLTSSNSNIDAVLSGSTVCMIFANKDLLYVANCGDSRCVVGSLHNDEFVAKELSRDHKPDLPAERARIESKFGRVAPLDSWPDGPRRVWLRTEDIPGLAMSRSIGDGLAHSVGVSAEPEIQTHTVDPMVDRFAILASDGVWEFIESEEAVQLVSMHPNPKAAAEALCKEAVAKWAKEEPVCDDITALILYFKKPE